MLPDNVSDDPTLRDKVEVFKDRIHAGKLVAEKLLEYAGKRDDSVVVSIPSGGVPVGYSIAKRLMIPLDVILVRKIPIPWEPEAGFGSVTFDGSVFLNSDLVKTLRLSDAQIEELIEKARKGLQERTKKFVSAQRGRLLEDIEGRSVLLVDDGLASGYTMLASVESLRKRKPKKILVAVPTGSLTAIYLVSPQVDKILCLNVRSGYSYAVADAYQMWYDVAEEEALELVRKLQSSRQ